MMIVNKIESSYHNDEQQQFEQVTSIGRLFNNNMRGHLILENTNSDEVRPAIIIENSDDDEEDISHDDDDDENEITIVQAYNDDDSDQEEDEETSRTKCCLLEFEMEEDDDDEEEELWEDDDDDQQRETNPYDKYRHYPQLQSKLIAQRQQQEDYRSSPTSTMSSSVFEFGETELSKNNNLFVPSSSAFPLFSNEHHHVTFGAVIQKQVYYISPNSDYTEEERQQLWYTQEEMRSMRLANKRRKERRSFLL